MSYCVRFKMPDGTAGVMRLSGKRPPPCCKCGAPSTRLCDWRYLSTDSTPPPAGARVKITGRRRKTCDAPLCDSCTSSPAKDKDLCPTHAAEWERRLGRRTNTAVET